VNGVWWQLWLQRLAAVAVATILFGTIYVVAQQVERLGANDGPLRLASQVASELRAGQTATLDAQPHVDLTRSLATFVVVEDAQGRATAGSGFLRGSLVSLPTGVLGNAAKSGEDDVTWQPAHGLRFATVTVKVGDQFVSAGQSLKPSEDRDAKLQLLVALGWFGSMIAFAVVWFALYRFRLQLQRRFAEQSQAPHSSE
jgi:hypothetical protein